MKKYSIFSLIFIAIVTLFVYIQNDSYTTFEILDISITLPNAVWIAFFLGLFYLLTLLFLTFFNLKTIIFKKNVKKDIETIISNIKNKILYKNDTKEAKIIKEINNFVKECIEGLEIKPKKVEKFEFLEDLQKLKEGEVVEISKYKLKENNPWFILNLKNRLKKDPSYAKEVLRKFKNEELKKEAFYIWAKEAKIKEILKYNYPITLDIILAHINETDLVKLLERAELTPKEEIEVAKKIYRTKNPDIELEIIKPLPWGYAYLALKYEHLELAKETVEKNSLKFFEYFLKLKECGTKADIDEYIQSTI